MEEISDLLDAEEFVEMVRHDIPMPGEAEKVVGYLINDVAPAKIYAVAAVFFGIGVVHPFYNKLAEGELTVDELLRRGMEIGRKVRDGLELPWLDYINSIPRTNWNPYER